MAIHYLKGDATLPQLSGNQIITHICNDAGGWGAGFVLAISKRWPEPEQSYRKLSIRSLGQIQMIQVAGNLWVCNMVAQHGFRIVNRLPPIRYDALDQCLEKLAQSAKALNASIHMPRIGCGLAGGKWEEVEPLITARLFESEVCVYDL